MSEQRLRVGFIGLGAIGQATAALAAEEYGTLLEPVGALVASSVLRGSYHLYQGIGGLIGNMAMGVVFVLLYRRWGRVGPLVAAHALIDIVAFVGYALLAGKVGWLPTA